MAISGGHLLARLMIRAGIRNVYGVAGGALGPLLHAIGDQPELRYLGTRHEAAGALMATAAFQSTGSPAVCLAEQGPGTHNLIAGLGSARANNLAVLAITVSGDSAHSFPARGALMQLDAVAALRPLTKWSTGIHDPRRLPEAFRTALRQALSGTPGPVHLDIPRDVLTAMADEGEADGGDLALPQEAYRPARPSVADPVAVAYAAALLAQARRPLLIAGGGAAASGADMPFRRLIGLLEAPATATQSGLGVVADDDPAFIGHGGVIGGPAVIRAMREADVVLAVGCRFSSWLWQEGTPIVRGEPHQRLIQIDVEPSVIGRARPVSLGLVGDAAAVLGQLGDALRKEQKLPDRADWLASLRDDYMTHLAELDKLAADTSGVMHPAALAKALAEAMPQDSLVVYDGGHTSFWSNSFMPVAFSRTRFHEAGMAQLGFGLPYANALAALHPAKTIVHITGDGSIGFTLQELDTARRYGLRAIHVIHNNEAWGVIRASQRHAGFELGTRLEGTDYAAIARGFGCHGERVETWDELAPAIDRALATELPAVLDVRVRFEPHPMFPAFGAALRRPAR
ncbi:thiamine pyrophosphate-binding protein [Streptomyces sp. B21-108]|jgi:acetolactate synthase-1/2/3 large subunit|uniref:thiamine pyrophosphate-binding protein n=1 Tax=Streptomyces sp. B21-108 TaxID=3039419 RepID=UPI002FF04778